MSGVVVVTGASGFIGKHLVAALQNLELDVRHCSLRQGLPQLSADSISHVFHLAGKTYVPESWSDPLSFYDANVLGTAKILDFCRRVSAPVTLVSSYVYGRPALLPVAEDQPVQAFNPYSHTKILAEKAGRYYSEAFGIPVTIVRPFNLYGPLQDSRFLIPTLLSQAMDPEVRFISVADVRPRRDFLFVDDFVDLLIRTKQSNSRGFRIFNAGSGFSVSVAELCAKMNALTGAPKQLVSRNEPRPNEIFDVFADISKAQRELGWEPKTPLEKGLALTMAAYRRCDRAPISQNALF